VVVACRVTAHRLGKGRRRHIAAAIAMRTVSNPARAESNYIMMSAFTWVPIDGTV